MHCSALALLLLAPIPHLAAQATGIRAPTATVETARSYFGFMKIDGVQGPATHPAYKGYFHVYDFSFGVTKSGPNIKSTMQTLVVATDFFALPQLSLLAAQGKHIKEVTLDVVELPLSQKPLAFLKVKLQDVVLAVVAGQADFWSNGQSLQLSFGKIEWAWQDPDSSTRLSGSHDLTNVSDGIELVPIEQMPVRRRASLLGYLLLPGIQYGSAKNPNYKGWFEINRFSTAVSQDPGIHLGRAEFTPLKIGTNFHALPAIQLFALQRKPFGSDVVLHFFHQGAKSWTLEIRLSGAFLAAAKGQGTEAGGGQELEIDYQKIQWTYQDGNGKKTTHWWDRSTNRGG